MTYTATKEGMLKGYWRIVNESGETVRSGLVSAKAAKEIAAQLTAQSKEDSE